MNNDINPLIDNIHASSGKKKADLLINDVQIADVYTESFYQGSIVVSGGKFVAISPSWTPLAEEVIDGRGKYAVPGFMDAHMHIEATLLMPRALAEAIVPRGTSALFVDAMEIANVCGAEGLKALVDSSAGIPLRVWLEVPSRVPTAPGLETTGGALGAMEVDELLKHDFSVSLGELDPSKVLTIKEEYLEKIASAKKYRKICNGHAIGLNWDNLNTYAAAGLMDDHESVDYNMMFDRLRLGIKPLVREGSCERNLDALVGGIVQNGLNIDGVLFCTDDKHVNDIFSEGHINYNVKRSVEIGLSPIKAIKIASLNAARHFRIDDLTGSITPGKYADFMLLDDLKNFNPTHVFSAGRLVARDGALVPSEKDSGGVKKYPEFLYNTVKLPENLAPSSFEVCSAGKRACVRVINLIEDQIINAESEEWLDIEDGKIVSDIKQDIIKLSVVERYGKNGRVGAGFVRGFNIKNGAIASSVSHDHHNIVVAGTRDDDMYKAVKVIEEHQGAFVAVVNGSVLGILPLPIAGLMSPLCADEVMSAMNKLNRIVESMGCTMKAPFMALSFISLPTVPELGLTDFGLIDVASHSLVPLVIKVEE
ncbi:MAG: adenine deaminase [Synergistaceae bacterium]|nr:adenine deaminase [Synergistaceae bacterium]